MNKCQDVNTNPLPILFLAASNIIQEFTLIHVMLNHESVMIYIPSAKRLPSNTLM